MGSIPTTSLFSLSHSSMIRYLGNWVEMTISLDISQLDRIRITMAANNSVCLCVWGGCLSIRLIQWEEVASVWELSSLLPALAFSDLYFPINNICLLKNCLQKATLPYDLARFFLNDLTLVLSEKTKNSKQPVGILLHLSRSKTGRSKAGKKQHLKLHKIVRPCAPSAHPHEVMRWPTPDSCSYEEWNDHLSRF